MEKKSNRFVCIQLGIQRVLKDAIVQLCVFRPVDPVSFLRQYFQKLERVSTKSSFASLTKNTTINSHYPRDIQYLSLFDDKKN
jgi:hypothetical protein